MVSHETPVQKDAIVHHAKRDSLIMDTCKYCGGIGYKTTGESVVICENMAYYGNCAGVSRNKPIIKPKTQERNEKCACGSGKKYKSCCLNK